VSVPKVLLIDSDTPEARELCAAMQRDGFDVHLLQPTDATAIERAFAEQPQAVLLSLDLATAGALPACFAVKKQADARKVPVVLLSSQAEDALAGVEASAVLRVPVDLEELRMRLYDVVGEPITGQLVVDDEIVQVANAPGVNAARQPPPLPSSQRTVSQVVSKMVPHAIDTEAQKRIESLERARADEQARREEAEKLVSSLREALDRATRDADERVAARGRELEEEFVKERQRADARWMEEMHVRVLGAIDVLEKDRGDTLATDRKASEATLQRKEQEWALARRELDTEVRSLAIEVARLTDELEDTTERLRAAEQGAESQRTMRRKIEAIREQISSLLESDSSDGPRS
jgi:hypothetical protein